MARYPCNAVSKIEQDSETGVPSGTPAFLSTDTWDTPRNITLTLSADEFRELLSALEIGAARAYPEKSHDIVWLVWGAVEYG